MLNTTQIQSLLTLAETAGAMAYDFRRKAEYRKTQAKADGSPVTRADLEISQFFMEGLKPLGWPVVSEEGEMHLEAQGPYFLVDPIDGTKSFARGGVDYAVLLALIEGQSPTFGVIVSPEEGCTYHAARGQGAFVNRVPLLRKRPTKPYTAYSSGFHRTLGGQKLKKFFEIDRILERGSALKFCGLADGTADFFPRGGPTGEWDTAAGQILLEESQCALLDRYTGQPLVYGKPKRLNRGFMACHESLVPRVHAFLKTGPEKGEE